MKTGDPQNELAHIRGLMDRSTRFLSLSGLSGVVAGASALVGALVAQRYMDANLAVRADPLTYGADAAIMEDYLTHMSILIGIALGVLVLALLSALWFTWRRSMRTGQSLWDRSAQRLLLNLFLPLAAGGIFCLALYSYGLPGLVPSATLVFYGLALLNASKYTLDEVRWLGLSEVVLGLVAAFWIGAGLMFWALGFGVLHIFYGALMYHRYERDPSTAA
ncbi:MAG: hypothetical protein KDC00_14765 [Flavobacteriales bacterium]|nr:hypothetical protein [Flavobacteriales bacterium]